MSIDEGLIESSRLTLYRAQEALGVLLVADGPVDAADEPVFEIPPDASAAASAPAASGFVRTDLEAVCCRAGCCGTRAGATQSRTTFRCSQAVFQPQTNYPSQFFTPANSWRFLLQVTVPIFDSGQRAGQKLERQSALDVSRVTLTQRHDRHRVGGPHRPRSDCQRRA